LNISDKLELQMLLTSLRVKKMAKEKRKPVASYDSNMHINEFVPDNKV
jgi:hypothetical protein